jgi:hypothetical protein
MPTGFTYASYQAAIVTQIPSLVTDPNFLVVLPDAIDYSELSILRDLDLVSAHGLISLGSTSIGLATQPLPAGLIVLEQMFFGPFSQPVTPASQDYIRAVWSGAANGPPRNFMVIGAATGAAWTAGMQALLGPAPDQAYALTGYGTERPATLSAANPTTFISTMLPDLFWSASMIFFSGYNRNFGAQSDNPQQAVSWKAEYDRLLKSATVEEARKTFRSQGWIAEAPTPIAQPRT